MNKRDERALKTIGAGVVIGGVVAGWPGVALGLLFGGAAAAEREKKGGAAKFIKAVVGRRQLPSQPQTPQIVKTVDKADVELIKCSGCGTYRARSGEPCCPDQRRASRKNPALKKHCAPRRGRRG